MLEVKGIQCLLNSLDVFVYLSEKRSNMYGRLLLLINAVEDFFFCFFVILQQNKKQNDKNTI